MKLQFIMVFFGLTHWRDQRQRRKREADRRHDMELLAEAECRNATEYYINSRDMTLAELKQRHKEIRERLTGQAEGR